jgi:tetratricopeptide (TPR) repeat protein
MKTRHTLIFAMLLLAACANGGESDKQVTLAQQVIPGKSADAHVAAAHALLNSWKGEIEVLEKARHELEAAWAIDRQNAGALKEFQRYQVVRKQMYEIQRKSRGGPRVDEVRKVLDSWDGESEVLARAQQLLDKLLINDPYNAYAPIEAARLEMLRGYLSNRYANNGRFIYEVGNYSPGTLERAERKLQEFRRFDPLVVDGLIMRAFIVFQKSQLDLAESFLKQAEAKGATDPRRYLYWADVYVARGRYQEAVERLQRVLREQDGDKTTMIQVHSRLARIYGTTGEAEKAIASHKTLIQVDAKSAWLHSNYAAYLSDSLGRYDEAIEEVHTALGIMNFGMGRLILADALYGKWAELVAEGRPDANRYFEEARKIKPDLDDVMAYRAALPTGERLAKALVTKGVSVDARTRIDGSTALLIATNRGSAPTVRFLLGMKANPNIGDQNGLTPFLERGVRRSHRNRGPAYRQGGRHACDLEWQGRGSASGTERLSRTSCFAEEA